MVSPKIARLIGLDHVVREPTKPAHVWLVERATGDLLPLPLDAYRKLSHPHRRYHVFAGRLRAAVKSSQIKAALAARN